MKTHYLLVTIQVYLDILNDKVFVKMIDNRPTTSLQPNLLNKEQKSKIHDYTPNQIC